MENMIDEVGGMNFFPNCISSGFNENVTALTNAPGGPRIGAENSHMTKYFPTLPARLAKLAEEEFFAHGYSFKRIVHKLDKH